MNLDDPTTATLAAHRALRVAGLPAAVYGGLALAAYGEPRETKDADLALAEVDAEDALEALRRGGLDVSLTFGGVRFGGILVTRVALLGGGGLSALNVLDLVEPRSARYARVVLDRAVTGSLRGEAVTVVSPEDFVLLKVLSTRDRDLEDAATVLSALGERLDRGLLEREATALATEVPDHDVRGRWRRLGTSSAP